MIEVLNDLSSGIPMTYPTSNRNQWSIGRLVSRGLIRRQFEWTERPDGRMSRAYPTLQITDQGMRQLGEWRNQYPSLVDA